MEILASILLCLCLLFLFVLSFLFSSTKHVKTVVLAGWRPQRPINLPPGPSPSPIIGNLLVLASKQPHRSLAELAKDYGPIMTLKLGSITSIIISSSKLAKQALMKNGMWCSTPFVLDVTRAHKHNQYSVAWLPSSSLQWRSLRKTYGGQLLAEKKLDSMHSLRRQKIVQLLENIHISSQDRVTVDIGQAALSAFFNIMLNTMFSRYFQGKNGDKSRELESLIYQIIHETSKPNLADLYPVFRFFNPQCIKYRLTGHVRKLFKIFNEIIDDRLKSRQDSSDHVDQPDILDVLLGVMEDQKEAASDRDFILHLLLDLFGAGMDTNAKTIEWAMSELLNNPCSLSKLQEELDKTVGKGKLVEESDTPKLPYLRSVLKENFRLHPPAPLLLPRRVEQDIEMDGFTLPKGANLLVNIWAIGRDPIAWENPNTFVPERFIDSDIDVKGQHFDLIPFGAGRRICPGMPLALRTVPSMLASLVNCFDWKLDDMGSVNDKGIEMEDEVKITLKKVKPLLGIPTPRI